MTTQEAIENAINWAEGQTFSEHSEGWRPAIAALLAEIRRLQIDAARLDWLADADNHSGQILLPNAAVEANVDSMRAAIDAAMEMSPNT